MEPTLDLFDHPLAVGSTKLHQELAAEESALVVFGDDWHVSLVGVGEAEVVRGGPDELPSDDNVGSLGTTVPLVTVQRKMLSLLDLGIAEVGERGDEQPPVLENQIGVSQIL